MSKPGRMSNRIRFLLYLAVVVLLNLVGTTLFFRIDLTANKIFSLSQASREAVADLSDPLTIKVFFTGDLPAPYNNTERYLRDLLAEYAVAGNRYFNYRFYDVSEGKGEEAEQNRQMARDYGIHPVQIRKIEQDEVRFQKVYMGMVLIHGDLIETIPAITSTEGLEYQITVKIRKMADKISALIALKENVKVLLFLSSSLQVVGPYMNLPNLSEVPGKVEEIVGRLKERNYGKLEFASLDPSRDEGAEKEAKSLHLLRLQWKAFEDRRGRQVPAGQGYAGLIVRYGDRVEGIPLIRVMKVPIFGMQYKLVDPNRLETAIEEGVENVIQVNERIGYLASNGCMELGKPARPNPQQEGGTENFYNLLREEYTVRKIDLEKETIPAGLASLIIAGPREPFTEAELYEIDQYLMKGRSLLLFLDRFKEVFPQDANQRFRRQEPVYVPVNTGLEKLLKQYGLSLSSAYVMDESCFKQKVPRQFGGGERPIYFAPIIKQDSINNDVGILKNIKGLVLLKVSPVIVDEQKAGEEGLKAVRLFSSSDRSWEMKGRINLNPFFMRPPGPQLVRKAEPLAYLLEGGFPSYFANKPIPAGPAADVKKAGKQEKKEAGEKEVDLSHILQAETTVKKGNPGKIFLVGTSEILRDNLIDKEGKSPNAEFVMNVVDALSGKEAYALMRTKAQRFNPLKKVDPQRKTLIKSFNIVGLPALVVLAGLLVWVRRASRKRMIQNMFGK